MIEINDRDLDVLLAEDPGGPVVMLNLLRSRPMLQPTTPIAV